MSVLNTLVASPRYGVIAAVAIVAVLLVPVFGGWMGSASAEEGIPLPTPAMDMPAPTSAGTETAVLAGGCFWGVQAVFQHVKGVERAVSGYSGGEAKTAHYEEVGSGRTGHAEAVEVVYDPKQISFGQILRIYFSVAHDPTQLNRQGPDSGTQYRSNIFAVDAQQQKVAEAYIAQLNAAKVFKKAIATRVDPLKQFYAAEGYHQDYLLLHPNQPYIVYNDLPKLENLKKIVPEWYRGQPVTVASTGMK